MSMAKGRRQTATQDPLGRYYTPQPLARAILDRFHFRGVRVVLEPHGGDGRLLGALHELDRELSLGLDLYALDLDPDAPVLQHETTAFQAAHGDFLAAGCLPYTWPNPDLIYMNPPYSVRLPAKGKAKAKSVEVGTEHVLRALGLARYVIAIMPSGFATGSERYERLWSKGLLERELQIVGRPSFTGTGTSSSDYTAFYFDGQRDPAKPVEKGWLRGWRS